MDVKKFCKEYKKLTQFDSLMEMDFELIKPGEIRYHLPIKDKHTSSPDVAHGGSLAGFMDAVLGMTVLTKAVENNQLCSTVEFKIHFLRPGKVGQKLEGTGEILFFGQSLAVSHAKIFDENKNLVATGSGTFNLYPMPEKFLKEWKEQQ